MTGTAPSYLNSHFLSRGYISRGYISGRSTRQSKHLDIPLFISTTGQRTFYYRVVKLWNDLNSDVKSSMTIQDFKRKLRRDLLASYYSHFKEILFIYYS